jgi:hypothetical protein
MNLAAIVGAVALLAVVLLLGVFGIVALARKSAEPKSVDAQSRSGAALGWYPDPNDSGICVTSTVSSGRQRPNVEVE